MLEKYTLKQLREDFPDDQACFDWLVEYLYPDGMFCKRCDCITPHTRIKGRRAFACGCGMHLYPLNGTIFENTRTPLTDWFHAIYMMSSNKAGTSAMQIQRELGVTYKCAWRMMHRIRSMMEAPDEAFKGEVEVDESFVHPNVYKRTTAQKKYGFTGRRQGEVLFGMIERGGKARIWHVSTAGARVLQPVILDNVKKGSTIHTDGYRVYRILSDKGYDHRWTEHGMGEFYTEHSSTQNVENLWSHLKRGIKGVYRSVDAKYLQLYANEYAWRYSHRKEGALFYPLLREVKLSSSSQPVLES